MFGPPGGLIAFKIIAYDLKKQQFSGARLQPLGIACRRRLQALGIACGRHMKLRGCKKAS